MPSAFISYAHEDQEFVLALVERLEAQGLDVRYDAVVLRIGDSLIRAISAEIAEGDFLIAVVSPDSLTSEWCQHEVSLAKTQGIDQRRVKVLPIKYREAAMPPMLEGDYYGDADRFDVETLARQLAKAMTAHMQGRGAEAAQEAAGVEDAGRSPAHAERVGDPGVAQLDAVAETAMEVIGGWGDVYAGAANLRDVDREQRRLRWAIEKLPRRAAGGLPLVTRLATAEDTFLASNEPDPTMEADIFEELRSVRTQLAQGLPVTRRWFIDMYIGVVPTQRDATAFLWQIKRGDETRSVHVYVSRTAMASADEYLPREVVDAKATAGRAVVVTLLALDDPPEEVMVSTAGVTLTLSD